MPNFARILMRQLIRFASVEHSGEQYRCLVVLRTYSPWHRAHSSNCIATATIVLGFGTGPLLRGIFRVHVAALVSAATLPVRHSMTVRAPLALLHDLHAGVRLPSWLVPPRMSGTT